MEEITVVDQEENAKSIYFAEKGVGFNVLLFVAMIFTIVYRVLTITFGIRCLVLSAVTFENNIKEQNEGKKNKMSGAFHVWNLWHKPMN